MRLYLKIKIFASENILIFSNQAFGNIIFFIFYRMCNLAAKASSESNKPLRVFFEGFFVYAGFVVVALKVRFGYEFYEVVVYLVVIRKYGKMIAFVVDIRASLVHIFVCDIHFTADDRLNAGR